uniref:Uncharacterized protein MANES_03G008000 n=1 Tax=Rhizophora mucronata TaxID=61149 RepID=A0A2P2KSR8_RHIMU
MEMQKRDVLLAEVRFLRQRHKQLVEIQSCDRQLEQDRVPAPNVSSHGDHVEDPWKMKEKPKSCLIKGKSVGKKKISWQDQVWL